MLNDILFDDIFPKIRNIWFRRKLTFYEKNLVVEYLFWGNIVTSTTIIILLEVLNISFIDS